MRSFKRWSPTLNSTTEWTHRLWKIYFQPRPDIVSLADNEIQMLFQDIKNAPHIFDCVIEGNDTRKPVHAIR
jgi:hypothetical protein